MRLSKNKTILFRKKIATLFIALVLFFSSSLSPAKAWDAIPAAILNYTLTQAQKVIDGIKLGLAKQAAIDALGAEVRFLVTGRSAGGAMFVTNWNSYMVNDPRSKANLYINDYITQSTRGRGSLSGYVSAGSEGVGASFMSQMQAGALAVTANQPEKIEPTYEGDPSQMFSQPQPFQKLNLYLSGVNNPWGFNLNVQARYQEKLQQEQTIAQTRVIAGQGFPGNDKDGITTMPGALVRDQISKVQNLGMDVIATARNLPEIITSAVTMTINQAMFSGIGMIQANVHREVTNVRNNAKTQINATIRTSGPGALYKR